MMRIRRAVGKKIEELCCFVYAKFYAKKPKTFRFQGKEYPYLYHHYNNTYRNERSVEIPIVLEKMRPYTNGSILEIGNVLSHYFPIKHTVVDKYEKADGVINEDVIDFDPGHKYDLILSISTLEHVGWDEPEKDPQKIPRALEKLISCATPDGHIIVTLPVGYNKGMDELLFSGKLGFTEQYFLKRVSRYNEWIETSIDDLRKTAYGDPYFTANGIVIGIIDNAYAQRKDQVKK